MPRILVLDGVSAEAVDIFKQAGFETDERPPQSTEDLAKALDGFDGLVVRSGTKVTAEALAAAKGLKVIGRAGAGTDNIDKGAATEHGIVVMNTPGGNTISTCEHTLALLFSLCRQIPAAHASMEAGRWDRKKFKGTEVYGKTLGVIGVGRIGGEVAKRAQAYGMKVLAFDPILTTLKAEALGVELVSVDELIERCDFITVHAPKSDKTNNMIRAEHFKKMKNTCRIVNCARGGIINEQDLADALKNGDIAGAALDVYTAEPFENNPFIGLDNIVMTPHLAASTDEAQLTVAVDIAKQMVDYLTTGAISNAVNVPSLDSETRKELEPLLYLADRLGQFQSQYAAGVPQSIHIEYLGDIGVTDTYPITATILCGFLTPMVESVNIVSAPSQLKARGIESSETRGAEDSNYAFEISVTVTTDQGEFNVRGTLFHGDDARICGIDGMRVDARPEGHMLVSRNQDVPMVIGRICTTLGDAGVNIANLTLGRTAAGGDATVVLNLDQPLDEKALESVGGVAHVIQVRPVSLPPATR